MVAVIIHTPAIKVCDTAKSPTFVMIPLNVKSFVW
jgi:hypothetical protein